MFLIVIQLAIAKKLKQFSNLKQLKNSDRSLLAMENQSLVMTTNEIKIGRVSIPLYEDGATGGEPSLIVGLGVV